MILVPLYYQEVRHESVIVTGLLTAPQGLGMLLVAPLTGRLTDRFGGGRVALAGVLTLSLSTIPLGFVTSGTSIFSISLVLLVRGLGIGFAFMPAMTAAFASLRPDQLSDATPQLNVLQRIGGAIGTAVLAVVLQRATGPSPMSGAVPSLSKLAGAFGTAYWWSFGISVLAVVPCVVLLRAERPRAGRRAAIADPQAAAEAQATAEPLGV
jgi:MFS family permease